ncbi:MAG: DNA-binding MarR family transcriptional regulator [Candidatus Aldehydirespiratoraceae bacterium]|jgi:DNA-binding MarR family transcriptional regulator
MISFMDTTCWLNEEEMRIWRAFIEVRGRVTTELEQSLKQNAGMTLDDYEVLVLLSEAHEQRMRMTAMSESLVHSQSRLTQRIDRLVKRGWVRREQCPEDRRGMLAVITSEGLAVIEAAAPAHVRDVRELLIDLIEPSERAVVAEVLERVAASARQRS